MRLRSVEDEFRDQVRVRTRPFPLELLRGETAPRDILEQEWWLAAIQEPEAEFVPYEGDDWPDTTLPAFDAAWAAGRQGEEVGKNFDLRIRRAFFGQARNIGRQSVMLELAEEAGLDLPRFERDLKSPETRHAVEEEARLGRERYKVRGTPTLMLPDGQKMRWPIAFPTMRERRIVGVHPVTCHGEDCLEATREILRAAAGATP